MARTIQDYANAELDRLFIQTMGPILKQAQKMATDPRGQLQSSLRELDEEAARLEEDKQPIKADNATLLKVIASYGALLLVVQTLIRSEAEAVELTGSQVAIPSVTAKVFRPIATSLASQGLDPLKSVLAQVDITRMPWVTPSADEIASQFVRSSAWIKKMDSWAEGYVALAQDTLQMGLQKGWGPRYTAGYLSNILPGLPLHAAENITRTLQLTSYREASLAMEQANSNVLAGKLRVATLDKRTCLACISLHGTPLKIGERVDDHHRGRCTEYYQVAGGSPLPRFMQADSPSGGRTLVPFQTGPDWFAGLSPARQKQQASFLASPGKLRAYRDGVALKDFVTSYDDAVFGRMIVEDSIIGALGTKGEQYYAINQPKE